MAKNGWIFIFKFNKKYLFAVSTLLLVLFVVTAVRWTAWASSSVTSLATINAHPIEAYADVLAVDPGQTINFYASLPKNGDGTQRTNYTVTYYRFGAGGSTTPVVTLGPIAQTNGTNQGYTTTSYVDGAAWSESFDLTVPTGWTSGIYGAKLVDSTETSPDLKEAWVTFMVHTTLANPKPIALLTSTNTYQAYNFWPGESGTDDSGSFYANCSGQNARPKISFQRPNPSAVPINFFAHCGPTDPNVAFPRNNWHYTETVRSEHLAAGDVRLARWLEQKNYGYSVLTDWDLDQDWAADQQLNSLDPAQTPTLIIGTHNEYWSQNMYNAVEKYLSLGGNVVVLGGNTLFWKVTMAIDPLSGNRTIQKGANWSDAERNKLFGIGAFNNTSRPYCYSNIGQYSTSHWAYKTPLTVPIVSVMGSSGEMKTPADQCLSTNNRAEAAGWEMDYSDTRFARSWTKLAGVLQTMEVFYFQRPSSGSVFVAGSITYGQSLMQDALSTNVMTPLMQNVLSRMNKRTFSDFSAADSNHPGSIGESDLLVRRQGEDSLRIYHGAGNDSFEAGGGGTVTGTGWSAYNAILPVGDFDSDGDADLLARDAAGSLHLYKGNGAGGFEANTGGVIDTGWGSFTALVTPGDWNGDGYPDLLARATNGDLLLYRGNGAGNFFAGGTVIKSGMNGLTLVGIGDFDYDASGSGMIRTPGRADLLARLDSNGELRLYHGNGSGFDGSYDVINQGWSGMKLVSAGDFDGDGHPDLLACVSSTGQMRVYHGTGGGTTLAGYIKTGSTSLGTGWACDTTTFAGVW